MRAFKALLVATPILALSSLSVEGAAQTTAEGSRLDGLRSCAAIADAAGRLACYDREAAGLAVAAERGEVRLVERREIERTRRGLFGFNLPKLGIFDGEDAPDTLETTITGVRATAADAWAIQVAEGGVWQITNAPQRLRAPRVGDPVVIRKAALGSFFIRIGGQLGVKGRRIS